MKQLADSLDLQALIDNLSVVDDVSGPTEQVSSNANIKQGVKLDKGQTHLQLAKVYFHKSAFGKAIEHSQQCEEIAQKSTNNNLLYDARLVEVESLLRIGRFSDAKILLLKTQDIKGEIDTDSLMCWLGLMAMCERRLGRNLAAAEYLSLGLNHASDALSEYWMASFCRDMSYLEMIQGNYHKAEMYAQQSVDSSEKTTDELLMESCIGNFGNLYFRMGSVDKALGCQLKALRYSERIGTADLLGGTYVNLGNVYYAQGDFSQASVCLRKAIAFLKDTENKKFYFNALNNYSHNEMLLGNPEIAMETMNTAMKVAEQLEDASAQKISYSTLGSLFMQQALFEKAIASFRKAQLISGESNSHHDLSLLIDLASCCYSLDKHKEAFDYLVHARLLTKAHTPVQQQAELNRLSYEIAKKKGDDSEALIYLKKWLDNKNQLSNLALSTSIRKLERQHLSLLDKQQFEILTAQKNILQSTNSELITFAESLAQELKWPLQNVIEQVALFESSIEIELSESQSLYLDQIGTTAADMNTLLSDLLEFAIAGDSVDLSQQIDLNEVIEQVADNLKVLLEESGSQLLWEHLPAVMGSKSKLIQLFQNLISNAMKFSRENVNPIVTINQTIDKGYAHIRIIDNGIGIEEQYQDQIFDIFKRLHTKEEYPGSGLGLAITQKIVDNLSGEIDVKSKFGEGTTFTVALPVSH